MQAIGRNSHIVKIKNKATGEESTVTIEGSYLTEAQAKEHVEKMPVSRGAPKGFDFVGIIEAGEVAEQVSNG